MKIRIFADFNNLDDNGDIVFNVLGTPNENENISAGMIVILYDEEFEVEARLTGRYKWARELWVASPDWSSRRDL